MKRVQDEKITNELLRKRFGMIMLLSGIWRCRLLKFVGRTSRQEPNALSRMFLSVFINKSMMRGRPFRKNKDAITESIKILMPSLPDSALLRSYAAQAQDKVAWEKMIKNLFKITYPRHNGNDCPNIRSRARAQQQNHNQNSNPNSSPPKTPSPPRKKGILL